MPLLRPPAAIAADDLDAIAACFATNGFALVGGLFGPDLLDRVALECADAQARLVRGELDERHGTAILDDPDAQVGGTPFAHYVCYSTEVSPAAHEAVHHPFFATAARRLLVTDGGGSHAPWLLDDDRFGVVFQDARTGDGAYYSRIGWHSDWQSGPHLDVWPSFAFTVHLDATSPANGFLRVVPGSQCRDPADQPPAFERIAGEVAVYAERGDVILHDARLWHSAARATDDGPAGVRRHLRGGWHAGTPLPAGHGVDDFVKNAVR